jgi:signal transduction histidine kinase
LTLAQRLLFAIGLVTLVTTVALGWGVRRAWRDAEESRFRAQVEEGFARLERDLAKEVRELRDVVGPLCRHDPMIDSILVDLRAGRFDAGRRLAVSLRAPALMNAFRLDELFLFMSGGEVLGAGHVQGQVGKRDPRLASLLRDRAAETSLRQDVTPLSIEAHCARTEGRFTVGVYAARHVDHLLEGVGTSYGVALSLGRKAAPAESMAETFTLHELGGVTVLATQSRVPLTRALKNLDSTIFLLGLGTIAGALTVAALLSRGLAKPIVELSQAARAVIADDPQPVRARGGRELEQLAASFNRAISDLSMLRKRLARAERIAARREIARRVAHEIKNPLAPIQAAVETLRRLRQRGDPAFDDYFDEATRTVLAEVRRISNIVSEFTRFARLPPPNPSQVDAAELVHGIAALYSAADVKIELEAGACPPIVADRDQLVQVLTNLLQNAVEAVAGRSDPRVWVELRAEGDRIALRVRDNGMGVSPSIRERLFEPYATNKPEGTGLGLAIVERIVIEHGGEIRYDDAPGGGALFTVTLPFAGPSLLPEAPISGEIQRPSAADSQGRSGNGPGEGRL